jgi:hypothetical protein
MVRNLRECTVPNIEAAGRKQGVLMKGWTRVGIVLSGVWAVVVVSFAAYEYSQFPIMDSNVHLAAANSRFIVIEEVAQQDAFSSSGRAFYEKLIKEAGSDAERAFYISARDRVHYLPRISIETVLISILLPIGMAWLLVSAGYLVFVWVRRGFDQDG